MNNFPTFAIPGVVDGKVLTESIGTALAAGRFARVPILNGSNHDEEFIFVVGQNVAVSGGTFVPLDPAGVTEQNYLQQIKPTLGVSDARAAAIAAEYPTSSYPFPAIALSALVGDANFACTARQVDQWTSARVPTFAYEFNDDAAPARYARGIPVATHGSELPYLFDLPNAPIQDPFEPGQQQLAASMRAAWARFAATGDPSTPTLRWPSFRQGGRGLSLVPPQPQIDSGFAARHHCTFWASDVTAATIVRRASARRRRPQGPTRGAGADRTHVRVPRHSRRWWTPSATAGPACSSCAVPPASARRRCCDTSSPSRRASRSLGPLARSPRWSCPSPACTSSVRRGSGTSPSCPSRNASQRARRSA